MGGREGVEWVFVRLEVLLVYGVVVGVSGGV